MKSYQPEKFESKWQAEWKNIYKTDWDDTKNRKVYVLGMFPYPSGAGLHAGHVRIYTATDVLSRYLRMKGYNVLYSMGWDAFGLPAENAAIKSKTNPIDMVPKNEENFRRQMQMLGFSYDWDNEFSTTDPSYYKWTQWLFLKLYSIKNKNGERLIYRKKLPINWCPFCKTGLANEEVTAEGTHERCGTAVEQRDLPQWVMRITDYADRLLDDLDGTKWTDEKGVQREGLDWPTGILEMQRNWIGKKEGININYPVKDTQETIVCFTTRPDTNFGSTFIVIAPEHEFAQKIVEGKLEVLPEVRTQVTEYAKQSTKKTELQRLSEEKKKTGAFTGFYAINPLNGYEMPIWISDFVLSEFGTGAVVGVPGHDMRDFQFATTFNIPIKRVVVASDNDESEITSKEQVQEKEGKMINSEFLNGMDIYDAKNKIMDYFEEKGWGKRVVTYHLRDWVFSRQRYWGEPFPLVYCDKCGDENGVVIIPDAELPVKLPYMSSYEPSGTGESPLATATDWVNTTCPKCKGPARRETDTMPNWAGSCWYFLRFSDSHNDKEAWSSDRVKKWLPVDWYLGGAEHAVLHLLYARFWVKAFYDLGLLPFTEPFLRLRSVGMVLAEGGKKMSKSVGNVVNPDDVVSQYGADALRLYEMFMGPWDQEIAWGTKTLVGCYRFLQRLWKLSHEKVGAEGDESLTRQLQKLIKKVGEDIEVLKFNTAIAGFMEFTNSWQKSSNKLSTSDFKLFLLLLTPFAPHISEELWSTLVKDGTTLKKQWPSVKEDLLVSDTVIIAVQFNGKVRGTVVAKTNATEKEVHELILKDEKLAKYLTGTPKKIIYVQNKVISFVL